MTWEPAVLVRGRFGRRLGDGVTLVAIAFAVAAGVAAHLGSVRATVAALSLGGWCAAWFFLRRGRGPAAPLAVMVAAVVALMVNGTAGSVGLGLLFVTPFLVGLLLPVAWTVAYVVGGGLMLGVTSGPRLDNSVAVGAQVGLLGMGVAAVPALLGWAASTVGRSRARADELNRELCQANTRLRESLVTQGELVLAEERARQARELHDGIGHQLTLVSLSLEFALRMRDRDAARAWAEVERAATTNQSTLRDIRLWVRALNPPAVSGHVGGADAFESIAAPFRGAGLDVTVRHDGEDGPLPDELALFATRFVQEGLTNVLKHAGAHHVRVDVVQSPAQLRLAVSDDGVGAPASAEQDGFGLRSLRERVSLLGGTLEARTTPGGGFRLAAVLPVRGADREVAGTGR